MKYLLSQTIFTGFILALYFAIVTLRKREIMNRENKLFVNTCVFSAIWSFGFFGVILQTDPQKAYIWRAIGMVGTFGYLISTLYLVAFLSGVKKFYCRLAEGFSLLGILLFFFVIQKEQTTYELSNIGMTYSFTPNFWNNLYIWYTVVVALNQLLITVYMIKKAKTQRVRELGKRLLVVIAGMAVGMLLDTVFPLFGQPAIPGSTIGQFAGLAALYHSVWFANHSRITIGNMSEFIYYSLKEPVLVYDAEQKLQIMNDAAYSFLGIDKKYRERAVIDNLFVIDEDAVFGFEESAQSIEAVCLHNDKYCNLTVNKIYDDYEDKIGYIITVADLSEQRKAMKQLEEAMNEADYANKAKSIFLANMSHEIRTPMNAILGFSELLLKMDIDEEARGHVEDIKWSSHNLLAIINDILDISKIESGKMEIIPDNYFIARLLEDVMVIMEPQAKKKGLEFNVKLDRSIPKQLYGDKVRIRGCLINILNNAVKYTNKGSITFEVAIISRNEDKIKLAFRVADTGIGIKPENLATLFDNFERLDQRTNYGIEGSGLGLAIAKGYVTLMGGDIKVESRYGVGSVFTIEIEQDIVDNSPIETDEARGKEAMGENKKFGFMVQDMCVLVVDDNPINLKVESRILEAYGFVVDNAPGGAEAVAACEKKKYDIIFMDQMMPEVDGIEAMLRIRRLNAHYAAGGAAKIIVLTANAIKGTRDMLMKKGFDEYLGKPLNIERLEGLLSIYVPTEKLCMKEKAAETSGVTEAGVSSGTSDVTGTSMLAESAGEETAGAAQNEDIRYMKATMPKVDVELGISHCAGEVDDYLKVLEITYSYGEKQLKELKNLWDEKAYKDFTIKVHSLKSTSLNIGASKVSEEAKRQEEAGLNENYAYIDRNLDGLIADYREILGQVKEVLVHYGILSEQLPEDERPVLDERMTVHMLHNIEKHIDDFNFAKVFDILEEAKKYRIPQQYEAILEKIEGLMDNLSVDEIKELLEEVR